MSIVTAVMPAPRVPVELRELAEPSLEPGSVLLRTLYSEVCGTYTLSEIHQALAAAAAMRLPKALGKPV